LSSAGFEPTIPANKRPQTHALDCAESTTHYITECNIKLSDIRCDNTFRLKLAIFTSIPCTFLILKALSLKQTSTGNRRAR